MMVIMTGRAFAARTITTYVEAAETLVQAAKRQHSDDDQTIARLEQEVVHLRAELERAQAAINGRRTARSEVVRVR